MTILPEIFTIGGIKHEMLKRTVGRKQDVALYKRTNLSHVNPTPHYEVILIGQQEEGEREIGGATVRYEAKELYPGANLWGTNGFTFQNPMHANTKYEELANRVGSKS